MTSIKALRLHLRSGKGYSICGKRVGKKNYVKGERDAVCLNCLNILTGKNSKRAEIDFNKLTEMQKEQLGRRVYPYQKKGNRK